MSPHQSGGTKSYHDVAIRIAVEVGIMQLLPTIKLLRINNNQQLRRFPVNPQMSLNVVSIPAIQHLEQDLVDLLGVGL
jgi:hypothetical protein